MNKKRVVIIALITAILVALLIYKIDHMFSKESDQFVPGVQCR